MVLSALLMVAVTHIAQLDPLTPIGSLTEQLRSPARIAIVADGTVLVSDPFNNHVARFDAAGAPLGTWSVPEGPLGVATHPTNGNYYVSLRDESKVAIYDSGFVFVGHLGEGIPAVDFIAPTDVDVATDTGIIYVVDTQGHKFYGFNPDGSLALMAGGHGTLAGQFNSLTAIAVDEPRNRIIVSDLDNFRIQVFTTGGVFLQHFGARLKYEGGPEGLMPQTGGPGGRC